MTMPDCDVCKGTGKYSPDRINELYRKKKPHRCTGHCDVCGQYFSEEDFEWLNSRLEKIEKDLKFIIDAYFKNMERRK